MFIFSLGVDAYGDGLDGGCRGNNEDNNNHEAKKKKIEIRRL